MEKYLIIAFVVGLVVLVYNYYRRNSFGGTEKNYEYLKVGDPNAQIGYDKGKKAEAPKLTAKELLELSWKFLYDLTEAVLYKFSATSRKATHDCGDTLVKNGARYTHVVDYAPLRNVTRARSMDDDTDDTTAIKR